MTTYYFCDNQTGSDPSCVPGNNGNAGTDPTAPKRDLTGFTFPSGQHIFAFAMGGAWTGLASITPQSGTSLAALTRFTSFSSPNYSSSVKPILNAPGTLFDFNKRSYFEVDNLDMRGPNNGSGSKGVVLTNAKGLYLHDNKISYFSFGVHASEGDLSARTTDFQVVNNEIHHNYNLGLEGCADRFLIENNNIHHNGFGSSLDHNVYITANLFVNDNVVVRGNTITDNGGLLGAASQSISVVAHGGITNILIEQNTIVDTNTASGHRGIGINGVTGGTDNPQTFKGLIIRNNNVVSAGSGDIGITWTCATDATVENNVIVHTGGTSYFRGILWDSEAINVTRGDTLGTKSTVRNNSIYLIFSSAPSSLYTAGIAAGQNGGGGDNIINNIIIMDVPSNTGAFLQAFQLNSRALSTFTTIANNMAYRISGTLTWSDAYSTLAASQAAGIDQNSLNADPLLVAVPSSGNSYSMALQVSSTAINAGHATKSARLAFGRYVPISTRDIGAYDYNVTVVSPMGVSGCSSI